MELHDSGARESCVALPSKIDEVQLAIDVKSQLLLYHYLCIMLFYGSPHSESHLIVTCWHAAQLLVQPLNGKSYVMPHWTFTDQQPSL